MAVDAGQFGQQAKKQGYIHRTLVGLDQFINVATGGAADDTISSRMQRWRINNVPKPNAAKRIFGTFMCGWLGIIQTDHDVKANAGDLGRAEAEELRTKKTLEESGAQDIH